MNGKKTFFSFILIFSLFFLIRIDHIYSKAEKDNIVTYEADNFDAEFKIYSLIKLQNSCPNFISLQIGTLSVENHSQYYLCIYENEEGKPVFYTFHYDEQNPYSFKKYREKTLFNSDVSEIVIFEEQNLKNDKYYSFLYDTDGNFNPSVIERVKYNYDKDGNKYISEIKYEIFVPDGTIYTMKYNWFILINCYCKNNIKKAQLSNNCYLSVLLIWTISYWESKLNSLRIVPLGIWIS